MPGAIKGRGLGNKLRPDPISELLGQTCLLQRFVGRMPRLGTVIYQEISLGDRAVPNFMVAPTLAHEGATCLTQDFNQFFVETRQTVIRSSGAGSRHPQKLVSHDVNRHIRATRFKPV